MFTVDALGMYVTIHGMEQRRRIRCGFSVIFQLSTG